MHLDKKLEPMRRPMISTAAGSACTPSPFVGWRELPVDGGFNKSCPSATARLQGNWNHHVSPRSSPGPACCQCDAIGMVERRTCKRSKRCHSVFARAGCSGCDHGWPRLRAGLFRTIRPSQRTRYAATGAGILVARRRRWKQRTRLWPSE